MSFSTEHLALWIPTKTSTPAANSVELERTCWTKSGLLGAKSVRVAITSKSIVFKTIYRDVCALIAAYLGANISWDPAKKYFQNYADTHTTISTDAKQITLDPNSNKSLINKLRLHLAAECEGNLPHQKKLIDEVTLNVVKQILHPQPQTNAVNSKTNSPNLLDIASPKESPISEPKSKKEDMLTGIEKTISTVRKIFLWPIKNPGKVLIGAVLLSAAFLPQGLPGNPSSSAVQQMNHSNTYAPTYPWSIGHGPYFPNSNWSRDPGLRHVAKQAPSSNVSIPTPPPSPKPPATFPTLTFRYINFTLPPMPSINSQPCEDQIPIKSPSASILENIKKQQLIPLVAENQIAHAKNSILAADLQKMLTPPVFNVSTQANFKQSSLEGINEEYNIDPWDGDTGPFCFNGYSRYIKKTAPALFSESSIIAFADGTPLRALPGDFLVPIKLSLAGHENINYLPSYLLYGRQNGDTLDLQINGQNVRLTIKDPAECPLHVLIKRMENHKYMNAYDAANAYGIGTETRIDADFPSNLLSYANSKAIIKYLPPSEIIHKFKAASEDDRVIVTATGRIIYHLKSFALGNSFAVSDLVEWAMSPTHTRYDLHYKDGSWSAPEQRLDIAHWVTAHEPLQMQKGYILGNAESGYSINLQDTQARDINVCVVGEDLLVAMSPRRGAAPHSKDAQAKLVFISLDSKDHYHLEGLFTANLSQNLDKVQVSENEIRIPVTQRTA